MIRSGWVVAEGEGSKPRASGDDPANQANATANSA